MSDRSDRVVKTLVQVSQNEKNMYKVHMHIFIKGIDFKPTLRAQIFT